ncbi:DUF3087 family protein [Thalassotalea agarivorans]|uniref:DUF3087 domain-containing protein n=1 Tax=Thalassotalea agarivorans TaxID=349064 RepID=A0A1I0EW07_THASX|nr:DUF3087 family protein [Thalassotalea agarivorans]SET49814.1 Protein of unknown function [Thalassotalea agarivorans]
MKLIQINKDNYKKTLNKAVIGFVILFAVLSITFGTILINIFVDTPITGSETPNNFRFNLLGVILALLCCAAIVSSIKNKPLFSDLLYVWQLKQLQNRIYRRLKKLQKAQKESNLDALTILLFYYESLSLVYNLDDNTLTMSSVSKDLAKVKGDIEQLNVEISVDDFDVGMVDKF